MGFVVVERSFDAPCDASALQAKEDAVAWCLQAHRVEFLFSFFSRDQRQMACLYEAPDAEAVRATQIKGDLPFDTIYSTLPLFEEPCGEQPPNFEVVVVQREFPPGTCTHEAARQMWQSGKGCGDLYRVTLRQSFVSTNGDRTLCYFAAPDADTTRLACDQTGQPYTRIWSASVMKPKAALPEVIRGADKRDD